MYALLLRWKNEGEIVHCIDC